MTNPANSANDIRALSSMEAMRIMPGMYIGGTDQRALHKLFFEAVGDAIEEVFNRPNAHIDVTIGKRITVSDNGEGYPLDIFGNTGQSMLERAVTLTNGRYRRKSDIGPYQLHGGIGIAVVNGLSSEFIIQTKQQGYLWRQTYEAGQKTSEVEAIRELGDREETGTIRTFRPDFTIFEQNELDHQHIRRRLREYAFLIPGLTISFEDKRRSVKHNAEIFNYPNGVQEFIEFINQDVSVLHPPLIIHKEMELELTSDPNSKFPLKMEIALQFTNEQEDRIRSFVNTFEVAEGGTHLTGLRAGFCRVLDKYLPVLPNLEDKQGFILSDKLKGLTAIVSLWYPASQWEGCMHLKLINPEFFRAVGITVYESFEAFATQHPEYMEAIVQQCIKNRDARLQRRYGD